MDKIILFFERNITYFVPLFFGIYIILYILKFDFLLLISSLVFISYFYFKFLNRENDKNIILGRKNNEPFQNMLPSLLNKYDDIINFLFYINDFKQYNEQVYNDFLININDFFNLYESYNIVSPSQKLLLKDNLLDTKNKILDEYSSFIYSFNNNPILLKKLDDSIQKLNTILNNYLNNLKIHIDNINPANNYL